MPLPRSIQQIWSAILLAAFLLLAACGSEPAAVPSTDDPTAPLPASCVETLRLPGGGYWGHPSPFGFSRGPGYMRASLVFDTLVWRDASGETIPWLATDWALSDDGLTWTFTLRDGVHWHDGQPLTADDVAFSIETYRDHPGTGWFMAQVGEIESATAVAKDRVAVKLNRPFAPFLQSTAEAMLIFPHHIWQDVADRQAFIEPEAFIGTGAYKLAEYSQEEGTYLFEANTDFFLGSPYVRRIEFVPTSDNILALSSSDIDAFDKFGGVTEEMLEPFRKSPFNIKQAPGEWGMFLYFNLAKGTPLQNVRVREAIAHAVDRQAMVERVLFGFGESGNPGFLPPANPFYNPDVTQYPYDLNLARTLLADAGYDGTPIRLAYSPDWLMSSPRVVEIIEAGLNKTGMLLERVPMDQASLDAAAREGTYELLLSGFGGLGGDPDQLRRSFATDSESKGFSRALGYHNAEFDALAQAQVAMIDPTERQAAVAKMQAILARDLPALALYYADRIAIYDKSVFDNWYFTPGGYGGGIPMPYNKHQFIVGLPEGLAVRGGE